MSLILEALKKAQRDRARHQAPEAMLSPYATLRKSRPMASWAVIAGAVLLFASGGVVTWWWGRAASPLPAPASAQAIAGVAPLLIVSRIARGAVEVAAPALLMAPPVVIRPILSPNSSVNQSAPSGPATMP